MSHVHTVHFLNCTRLYLGHSLRQCIHCHKGMYNSQMHQQYIWHFCRMDLTSNCPRNRKSGLDGIERTSNYQRSSKMTASMWREGRVCSNRQCNTKAQWRSRSNPLTQKKLHFRAVLFTSSQFPFKV